MMKAYLNVPQWIYLIFWGYGVLFMSYDEITPSKIAGVVDFKLESQLIKAAL